MKKVLIITASYRKGGNSDVLCDMFAKGALESGNKVEKLYLADHHINYCRACYACKTSGKCIYNDDMAIIIDKMKKSDVIVLATPVYFYSMAGNLKTMIDRCVGEYLNISNKEFYFIASAAEGKEAIKLTIDGLRGFIECLDNPSEKGVIYGEHAWKVNEILNTKAIDEAYEMGKSV